MKFRIVLLLIIFGFFMAFITTNSQQVRLVIPFVKTFGSVPLFVVISVSFVIGVFFHIIMGGKSSSKRK
jgi:uncharacterized integral membrane protein